MHLDIDDLNSRETPFYYYDLDFLETTLSDLSIASMRPDFNVHYAVKANGNRPILELIANHGFGADCVSGNEIKIALESGFANESIVFAGVGKTDDEITYALNQEILCFNCESIQEIEIINELAYNVNKTARIAIRINPNINAETHEKITTGLIENKFGISMNRLGEVLEIIKKSPNIELSGVHFHIGSQITKMYVFRELCARINGINRWFNELGIQLEHINVGGGLGIDYDAPRINPVPNFQSYFALFDKFLQLFPGQQVHFELGRSVVGQSGMLVTKVLFVKEGESQNIVVCDAGMTELLRPALYQAKHHIENISSIFSKVENYTVVGPICETSDCFGKNIALPSTKRGDLLVMYSAGAYGEVMASNYNLRNKVGALYRSTRRKETANEYNRVEAEASS